MGVVIRTVAAVAVLAAWPVVAAPAASAEPAEPAASPASAAEEGERVAFRLRDPRITESSGLATSPTHPGIVYTHNDSDASPSFFAVDGKGRTKAVFRLRGAEARDWEAMAATTDPETGRGVLWFADIGDNMNGAWPDISVYRVAEPAALADATLPATRYRFRYEDGGHNAEGLLVNPRTGRLYVVTKQFAGAIYAAPRKLSTGKVNVLRKAGAAPLMATDAAYAPDGSSFVIRTYFSATMYSAPDKTLGRVTMPTLDQAESITYTRDGRSLLVGSEGKRSPVYQVPVPAAVLAKVGRPAATPALTPAATRSTVSPSASPVAAPASPFGRVVWLYLAFGVGAIAIIAFIARLVR